VSCDAAVGEKVENTAPWRANNRIIMSVMQIFRDYYFTCSMSVPGRIGNNCQFPEVLQLFVLFVSFIPLYFATRRFFAISLNHHFFFHLMQNEKKYKRKKKKVIFINKRGERFLNRHLILRNLATGE
jgi:hypothetical protein